MTASRFAEQLSRVPTDPGVYIMRNAAGDVIYVGKAANLRNRVRSYFGSPLSMEGKTRLLSESIADFEYVVTHTEQEALHLEAELVKRHQPLFNVRLKDDKHYPYLKVDLADPWPRIYITRRVEKDGGRYFGPFANAGSVRRTLDLVNKLFPWRSCTKTITGNDPRPCLDYYINRCIAPCTSYCTKEEYDEVIRQVILFLEGRTDEVTRQLKRQMRQASEAMQFEQAARIRDQLQAIERVTERQTVASTKPADEDVFGLARGDDESVVQVLFVRGTKTVGLDNFTLAGTRDETDADVMASFIKQFYESATYVPKVVIVPVRLAEQELIESWLAERRGSRVEVHLPQRGERRRLVEMAQKNAAEALEMARVKWLADKGKTNAALSELEQALDLPGPPRRIECYDISNIQGTSSVGSMVVFVDGHPRPQEYRRFRIRTVEGANDFASMAEVLRRRFRRARERVLAETGAEAPEFEAEGASENGRRGRDGRAARDRRTDESFAALPDLVIIDGGKGQLAAVVDVMREMGVKDIPAVGLAKQHEEIYVQDVSEPVVLPRTSQALYLVQRIRDEAHRFAITYHRGVRKKAGFQSALDTVPGVGPKRKKALLKKFGSVRGIREASVEEVATTVGFTAALAEKVKAAL
ncbi:MAG TPA: excinuclease ABC subunit UvrC [Dehalococcoidia bacterium]|nr:excinuclease ABC subunit UvrC [Dehalococcoidia bacterium]